MATYNNLPDDPDKLTSRQLELVEYLCNNSKEDLAILFINTLDPKEFRAIQEAADDWKADTTG